MKNQIQKAPKLYKNLTLTGMMGVGKSTIGKNLAKKLNYNFVDIDKLIEKDFNMPISKIFSSTNLFLIFSFNPSRISVSDFSSKRFDLVITPWMIACGTI